MQSTRPTSTAPRRICKAIITTSPYYHRPTSACKRGFGTISSFPYIPSAFSIAEDISPLFRLLDPHPHPLPSSFRARRWAAQPHLFAAAAATTSPRFDVRERTAAFELQGELPGLQQKDVTIEFIDQHTLVIRGRVEREETTTNMNVTEGEQADHHQQSVAADAAAAPSAEASSSQSNDAQSSSSSSTTTPAANTPTSSTADADAGTEAKTPTAPPTSTSKQTDESNDSHYKYWINERLVIREFERHFKFHSDVDQEAVKASLKNGILNVIIPKIVKTQKKIVVEG